MLTFWDVDTLKDFMNKNGAFYVSGAEKIKPNLKELTQCALEHQILIMAPSDCHFKNDKELETLRPHCMNKTEGQKKIPETLILDRTATVRDKIREFGWFAKYTYGEMIDMIKDGQKQIIFEKQHNDVFINPHVGFFLEKIGVTKAVVYGVATEYCVKEAVEGLLKRGVKVYLVTDAIKGINEEQAKKTLEDLSSKGVHLLKCKEVIHLINGEKL